MKHHVGPPVVEGLEQRIEDGIAEVRTAVGGEDTHTVRPQHVECMDSLLDGVIDVLRQSARAGLTGRGSVRGSGLARRQARRVHVDAAVILPQAKAVGPDPPFSRCCGTSVGKAE